MVGRLMRDFGQIQSIVCLTFVFLIFVGFTSLHAAEPIKIGAVLSITGFASALGTQERDGIQLELDKLNSQGGVLGRPLVVYIEDDQSDPTNAANATTKLIRDKQVCAIIGSSPTSSCMAMVPICEREQIPNVTLGTGHELTNPFKKTATHRIHIFIFVAPTKAVRF